jgi:hypothetical protein
MQSMAIRSFIAHNRESGAYNSGLTRRGAAVEAPSQAAARNCGAIATLSAFLNDATLRGGLLGRIRAAPHPRRYLGRSQATARRRFTSIRRRQHQFSILPRIPGRAKSIATIICVAPKELTKN